MEGCDADEGGAPTDWTTRRYRRFAKGGAGLVWIEAVSVLPEGRANPHQLMITEENLPAFKKLADDIREAAREEGMEAPRVIVQLTHSGRWSRPVDEKRPIRAWRSQVLDSIRACPRTGRSFPTRSSNACPRCSGARPSCACARGLTGWT